MASVEPQHGGRMSLGRVIELMLARGGHGSSSVSITRNAKGEVQTEVVVRTGEDGDVRTPEDAERVACEVFDRITARYPMSTGHVRATGDEAAS